MDNITFEFKRDRESVLLDGSLFSVLDYDGLESSDYKLDTAENVNADGEQLKSKKVLSRPIMVEFDYMEFFDIPEMRQKLIRFFSPYSPGILEVNYLGVTRQIEYEVSSFKISSRNVNDQLSCLLYVKCMEPSFKTARMGESIMTLIGGLKFPLKLPFKLKQFGPLKKNVYNDGHMPAPVEIYFKGPAVNPKVVNHRTGEYIRIKRTLTSDEAVYINTAFRKKAVVIINRDTREDAWDYLDLSSSFFWLQEGDNLIEFISDAGVKSKGVEIYYQERYLGV